MNKTAIKNFAVRARVQLIEAVKQKAFEYGILEVDGRLSTVDSPLSTVDCPLSTVDCPLSTDDCPLSTDDCPLPTTIESEQRKALLARIDAIGYAQTMEEAAYTWFNRFIALRFMEVNGYLPSKVRVFTDETGAFKPEILKQALSVEIDGLNREKVLDLVDKQDNEGLYKYLIITQCNALNAVLPHMFEKIANWMELLFPDDLLKGDSVIGRMISDIPVDDWHDNIEIIGWLYQYYNAELKDETFALLKKNVKITKERIPAATQLFTPDWIVRYMVENSLGRILVDSLQWTVDSEEARVEREKQFAEKMGWKYYLPEAPQTPEVRKQLSTAHYSLTTDFQVENLKIIDPCMGSGHILVYAFDVLMQIYAYFGRSESEAAKSILENNLYGLDIDDRVGQLAYFAVMMKARKYNRSIMNGKVMPNVVSIQDSNLMTDEFIDYVAGKDADMKADLVLLRKTFKDAKEYGSILNAPAVNYDAIYDRIEKISGSCDESLFVAQYKKDVTELLLPLVKQAQIMSQKYDVVVTNPPYMGRKSLNNTVGKFLKENYPAGKSELYSAFIVKCIDMTKSNGFTAMITIHTWMFISSFEELRKTVLRNTTISSMMHTGAATFEDLNSFNVLSTAFSLRKVKIDNYISSFLRLADYYSTDLKLENFHNPSCCYYIKQNTMKTVPGNPFVYWISDNFRNNFIKFKQLRTFSEPKQGLATGNNDEFVRLWQEVDLNKTGFGLPSAEAAYNSKKKWFPYNKGGEYRKWYGMNEYVVNWEKDGFEIKHFTDENGKLRSRPQNTDKYFRQGITWSLFGFENFGVRYKTSGFVFDVSGSSMFPNEDEIYYILAFLASSVSFSYLSVLAPTVNFQVGNIGDLPLTIEKDKKPRIDVLSKNNISISKTDWDSFETSWDFKRHPLV
ncbi:MAG: BREX-1 system adenine-specific DNA-methyltransferase PglX [Clostridiales bacterium]|nr:BREX-1 system adenine-specific DNA-methyltransferase PglX [Clostridiales bacterium]